MVLTKRNLTVLLSVVTLTALSFPAMARGISTLKAATPKTRINVRTEPTIKSSAPQYGLPGDKVQVIKCVQDKDTKNSDLNWCEVKFVKSKAVGWVRSDFIIFADGGE